MHCYLDGKFLPLEDAGVPLDDLGLLRGYAIFDFIRITNGKAIYLDDHLERFESSAQKMRLPLHHSREALKELIAELMRLNGLPHAGLRLLLTGGSSSDGYTITAPKLIITQQALTPPPDTLPPSFKLVSYPYQRELPGIKTTNYAMAVWLKPWVDEQQADDLLYHQHGVISESPRCNFFLITNDNRILTPGGEVLPGITRKQLLRLGEEKGLPIHEAEIRLEDLRAARGAFISSTTKRIIPVRQIDDIVYEHEASGALCTSLYNLLIENERR